jgi:hypothetical protein
MKNKFKKYILIALKNAKKKAEKAKRKRNQRKTPYPFGFEYRSDRK